MVWGWVVVGSKLSVEAPLCVARRSLRVTPTPESFEAAIRTLSLSHFSLSLSLSLSHFLSLWVKFDVMAT